MGYNERLFSGGFRTTLHEARFHWLQKAVKRAKCERVIELGCFDGRSLDYLPKPTLYKGFDANWEGGLDLAQPRPGVSFHYASTPEEMTLSGTFDTAISMETLEHLPPELVSPYLEKIASHLDGYFFATVPVEIGPVFLAKWLAKKAASLRSLRPQPYTSKEVLCQTLGLTNYVRRDNHMGFNYRDMVKEIGKHFDVLKVEGCPWRLPPPFCFTVGIVASSPARSGTVLK